VTANTPPDAAAFHSVPPTTRQRAGLHFQEKAMTIPARMQTSTRLAGLLIAAATALTAPYGAAAAVRAGLICFIPP
jgi:hypothetical protein